MANQENQTEMKRKSVAKMKEIVKKKKTKKRIKFTPYDLDKETDVRNSNKTDYCCRRLFVSSID